MREDRQASAGLSHVGKPKRRDSCRTSILSRPASTSGDTTRYSIAAALPWFEVFCGLLLVCGIAVRGAALLSLAMLVPFTWIVLQRALAIREAKAIPLCAVRFDCGCGGGEVFICHKLLENGLLMVASGLLVAGRDRRWCLRHDLRNPG